MHQSLTVNVYFPYKFKSHDKNKNKKKKRVGINFRNEAPKNKLSKSSRAVVYQVSCFGVKR